MSTSPSLEGIKVLVVDDDDDLLAQLQELLAAMHATVAIARSGPEAVSLLQTFRPDVLVSDIGMPDCDGYQLMRMIRVRGHATAAIALTGHASSGDHTRALLAGFSAHIAKPFAPSVLCAAIQRLARDHGRSCSLGTNPI